MYRGLLSIFLLVFITACGVDTSSSNTQEVYSTTTTTESNSSDTNTSDSDLTDETNTTQQLPDAIYDSVNATYDPNACNVNSYRIASDASYAGSESGENGASLFSVLNEGLWIGSEHLEADPTLSSKTWVTLYYHPFVDATLLGNQGDTTVKLEGVFQLIYDVAWSDESIEGLDNTVYVKSAKTEPPTCYKMKLNTVLGSEVQIEKVYR